MYKAIFLAAAVLCCASSSHAQQQQKKNFYLHNGDRVVFYGDSITDQRNYTMMIETYIVTRYPRLQLNFINSGWGGDTVSGGGGGGIDLRLKRDVVAYNPTVVTIMLGMNDGGYKAATAASDQAFFDGFRHIAAVLKQDLPDARITAIAPSPYDDVTRPPEFPVTDGDTYNEVMIAYGKWIKTFAQQNNLTFADANTDFVHMLERANQLDPAVAKTMLPHHIHPTFGASLVLGEEILKAWDARPIVASVAIQTSGAKVKLGHTEHAVVSDLVDANGSIRWTETDDALPLPFIQWEQMWGGGPTVGLAIRSSDITKALNEEPLRVSGLKNGVYSVLIDGTSVGAFTNDQLADGVNLAILKTPMSDQAMQVYQLTVQHGDLHYDRWRHVEVPFATLPTAAAAMSSLDALEASVVEKQRAAAIPRPHNFEIVALQ